jgi:hypothetical protein
MARPRDRIGPGRVMILFKPVISAVFLSSDKKIYL